MIATGNIEIFSCVFFALSSALVDVVVGFLLTIVFGCPCFYSYSLYAVCSVPGPLVRLVYLSIHILMV